MTDTDQTNLEAADESDKTPWVMREPAERAEGEEANNPIGLLVLLGLLGFLWYAASFRHLLFVFGLIIMVALHELGHFMTARWTGMKASQFFIGFGPRIWSMRRGETEYGLRAIPAGAFVRIHGMNNLDPVDDPVDAPRAYMNKSYPRRMLVITAGSMMHFIQAVLLFVFAFSVLGTVDPDSEWEISLISGVDLLEDSTVTREVPAVEAGLQPGDRIVTVDGVDTSVFADLRDYVQARPGRDVVLSIEKADGSLVEVVSTLTSVPAQDDPDTEVGFLGIRPSFADRERAGPWVGIKEFGLAMKTGITTIPSFFAPDRLANLGNLVFQGSEDVALTSDEAAERPISLVGAVRIAGNEDFDWFAPIAFLGFINVFVGLVNLVPLMPLDGGHAAIATYERIRSIRRDRPYQADVAKLLPLTYGVVALLAFLFLSTVWLDIVRPIG
ncbi:MAG: membrane-associated protease RseP (regulator of RpoE activity) [Acidimicrobiales bacterium]|jgi:membrane-associated protease RseP (regulator of RpoE activity)